MKIHFLLCLAVFILCLESIDLQAYDKRDVYQAWENKDVDQLIKIYSQNESLRPLVEDAMISVDYDYSHFNYEQLEAWVDMCGKTSTLGLILNEELDKKKAEILKNVSTLTPDQLPEYLAKYPYFRSIIKEEVKNSIMTQLPEFTLGELYFIQDNVTEVDYNAISKEASTRIRERQDILKQRVSDYSEIERQELQYLMYLLKRRTYEYLLNCFRRVCYQYASIAEVPESVDGIQRQYANIVENNLNTDDLQKYLQMEVDAVCSAINSSRVEYCKIAGFDEYVPLSINVPQVNFYCHIPLDAASKIPEARETYKSDRETISDVGSVASWIFGSFVTKIGEGLADMWVGSSLTDAIINARMQLVGDSFESVRSKAFSQVAMTVDSVQSQLNQNQAQFVHFIKNYEANSLQGQDLSEPQGSIHQSDYELNQHEY